jgi:hypothetical protein
MIEDTRSIKGKSVPINNNTKRSFRNEAAKKEPLYTRLDYIFISVFNEFSVFNDTKIPEYSASILYSSPKLHILFLKTERKTEMQLRINNILTALYLTYFLRLYGISC